MSKPIKKILILVGHGSRNKTANHHFEQLFQDYSKQFPPSIKVMYGYIEAAQPSLEKSLNRAISFAQEKKEKNMEIIIQPLLLLDGNHSQKDIPRIVQKNIPENPHLSFLLAPVLGVHQQLSQLAHKRVWESGFSSQNQKNSALLFLGRGSLEKRNQLLFKKQYQLFIRHSSFSLSYTCFSGLQKPSLEETLETLEEKIADLEQILLVPHLLFRGLLFSRAQKEIHSFQKKHPHIQVFVAPPLGSDSLLWKVLVQRYGEASPIHLGCT